MDFCYIGRLKIQKLRFFHMMKIYKSNKSIKINNKQEV